MGERRNQLGFSAQIRRLVQGTHRELIYIKEKKQSTQALVRAVPQRWPESDSALHFRGGQAIN